MKRIPSTKALRAFEAVARLGSIKLAAEQLSVSPSALGRRIQALEEELGNPLFLRDPRGLTLTDAGQRYAERLKTIFQSLAEATDNVRLVTPQQLNILVPSIFSFILLKHLKQFEEENPHVRLTIDIFSGLPGGDPRVDEADVAIFFGTGNWEGWDSIHLTPNAYAFVVCTPDFLPNGPVATVEELAAYTWIRNINFKHGWSWWCEAAGCPGLEPKNYFDVGTAAMGTEASRNGIGLWLSARSPRLGPDPYFRRGLTVLAHPFHAHMNDLGYYLVCRPRAKDNPSVVAFREWILSAALHTFEP